LRLGLFGRGGPPMTGVGLLSHLIQLLYRVA
jgi:hypothetical protein